MPAPAVYILAVVGTVSAAFAFKHFVYDPHLAPKFEQWKEEYLARRRAMRAQRQGLVPVPASSPIPLRRRRGNRRSESTHSDSDDGSEPAMSGKKSDSRKNNTELDTLVAREVSEWRNEVQRIQTISGLRHRTNLGVHVLDQSINPIPHPPMSPTHVLLTDTSVLTTPSSTATLPSALSSPTPQVSPMQPAYNEPSSLHSNDGSPVPSPPSRINTFPSHATASDPKPANQSPLNHSAPELSPPPVSSPIPSLSQSYPQELDRERGVELLSPPSSGTSSPFSTFSPFVAPQSLSPYTVIQPLDQHTPEDHTRSRSPVSQTLSQNTITHSAATSTYQSFASSPMSFSSDLSSPVDVSHRELRSPVQHDEELSYLSSPSPVNFTSPHVISPRSPHSDLSELEFSSDEDVLSDPGSDQSWAGISSHSGSKH